MYPESDIRERLEVDHPRQECHRSIAWIDFLRGALLPPRRLRGRSFELSTVIWESARYASDEVRLIELVNLLPLSFRVHQGCSMRETPASRVWSTAPSSVGVAGFVMTASKP